MIGMSMTGLAGFRIFTKQIARKLILCSFLCALPAAQLAQAQAPTVSSVTPNIGPTSGGKAVTIAGSNFLSGATVMFGTVPATSVTFVSAAKLTAVTPKHAAGAFDVSVTDSGGTGALASGYSFTNGPALFTVGPNSGQPGGGNVVKLSGANLKPVNQVLFGSSTATIQSTSAGQVQVVAPSGVGRVDVTVQSPYGKSTVVNGYVYTMSITTTGLDDSNQNLAYSNTLKAIGGRAPLTWSIVSGKLPVGLTLSSSTGTVSGTPTSTISTYTVKFQVMDSSVPPESATTSITFANLYGFRPIPIPASFFGMSVFNQSGPYPTVAIGSLGKGDGTDWPFIEQTQGVFNWTNLDQYVSLAKTNGVSFYWVNSGVPPWAAADTSACYFEGNVQACPSTVSNMQYLDDFIHALLARYNGITKPKIQMYELWNEPDVRAQFTGTMSDMIQLTTHIYNDVRAGDPAALIGSPSALNANWLLSYFQQGGPKGVDQIDVHGYPNVGLNDVPEAIVSFKSVNPKINLAQVGLQNLPIINSEGSWGGQNAIADADYRASFVARYLLENWSVGMHTLEWYEWDGPVWGTLWTPTNGITPAGTAYGIVEGWMTGATMPSPCSMNGGTYYKAIYTCDLTRSGGYEARAVWDTTQTCKAGVCTTAPYTPDPKYVQYKDIAGSHVTISPGQTVQIGLKPILLENMNAP
jgi:hypothetical protein